jgi:hypothetical protein
LAQIIEPASKLDSLRVLEETGESTGLVGFLLAANARRPPVL